MLDLKTVKQVFEFKVDGKKYALPLTPTVADIKRAGVPQADANDASAAINWFTDFARAYLASIDDLSLNDLSLIMQGWQQEQVDKGEANLGE